MTTRTAHMPGGTVWFGAYAAACAAVFWEPLHALTQVALTSDTYSHILLIPFISLFLLWMERERLLKGLEPNHLSAGILLCGGVLAGAFARRAASISPGGDWLTLAILGFLCVIWAGFLFFYGSSVFKDALFPLLFLLLMVPLPGFLLDRFIEWLQVGSADVAEVIFRLSGTPVLRED